MFQNQNMMKIVKVIHLGLLEVPYKIPEHFQERRSVSKFYKNMLLMRIMLLLGNKLNLTGR